MTKNDVDTYIAQYPKDRQLLLNNVRKVIKETLPEAEECIKYGIPTYFQKENLVHFSNAKHHIGFYPTPEGINHFKKELAAYKTSKGTAQFPVADPIPYELIRKICLWKLNQLDKKVNG